MIASRRIAWLALAASAVLVNPWTALADDPKPAHSAVKPVDRKDKGWVKRHESFVERAKKGNVDVLFLGDSITQGWENNGRDVWKENFAPLKAANFGIGGDQTGHVLWRLTEGQELEGLQPKVAVIMIGTNNTGGHSAADIAGGIEAIVTELRKQRPHCKVLLLGVFPRGSAPKDDPVCPAEKLNPKIRQINERIAKLDDGKMVIYKDIGPKFLNGQGGLSREIMPDLLHLSPKGYTIWAEAIKPDVEKLLK